MGQKTRGRKEAVYEVGTQMGGWGKNGAEYKRKERKKIGEGGSVKR